MTKILIGADVGGTKTAAAVTEVALTLMLSEVDVPPSALEALTV